MGERSPAMVSSELSCLCSHFPALIRTGWHSYFQSAWSDVWKWCPSFWFHQNDKPVLTAKSVSAGLNANPAAESSAIWRMGRGRFAACTCPGWETVSGQIYNSSADMCKHFCSSWLMQSRKWRSPKRVRMSRAPFPWFVYDAQHVSKIKKLQWNGRKYDEQWCVI